MAKKWKSRIKVIEAEEKSNVEDGEGEET